MKQILGQEDSDSNIDINAVNSADGRSALHLAVLFGHSIIAEELLKSERFEIVNARDKDENTALHLAYLHGREDVVGMLLASPRFNAVSLQNRCGGTALHCASARGYGRVASCC